MDKNAFLDGYTLKLRSSMKERTQGKELSDTAKKIKEAILRLNTGDADVPVASGLHRVFIEGKLNTDKLKDMGYFESRVAVPERGQAQIKTWRNTYNNSHLHRHDDGWFMHQDDYPSLQAILRRLALKKSDKSRIKNTSEGLLTVGKGLLQGTGHAVLEGAPGYASYIQNSLGDTPTFSEAHSGMGKGNYLVGQLLSMAAG